jgi:UDP-N-acetylenolpyruvoylglucosamine reductase
LVTAPEGQTQQDDDDDYGKQNGAVDAATQQKTSLHPHDEVSSGSFFEIRVQKQSAAW